MKFLLSNLPNVVGPIFLDPSIMVKQPHTHTQTHPQKQSQKVKTIVYDVSDGNITCRNETIFHIGVRRMSKGVSQPEEWMNANALITAKFNAQYSAWGLSYLCLNGFHCVLWFATHRCIMNVIICLCRPVLSAGEGHCEPDKELSRWTQPSGPHLFW